MASDHYRTLAKQYILMAERSANPLLAEGYRKLAEGYAVLAEAEERSQPKRSGETTKQTQRQPV